jgi:hypothetical protein
MRNMLCRLLSRGEVGARRTFVFALGEGQFRKKDSNTTIRGCNFHMPPVVLNHVPRKVISTHTGCRVEMRHHCMSAV